MCACLPAFLPAPHPLPDNYVHDMQDAGMALMESFNADIHDNTFENCKYGIRFSLGAGDNQVYDNTFDTFSQCETGQQTVFRFVEEDVRNRHEALFC